MVNILVAEKSTAARQAIVDALARIDAIAVQGAVAELREAVRSLCRDTPDLVVTGVELADASGLDLIEATRQLAPESRIVVVGPSPGTEVWRRQVSAGAIRFVPAGPGLAELREVVTALARPAAESAEAGAAADDADGDPLRLLGRIAAGVAHDLGNQLSALAATIALMDGTRVEPSLLARARLSVDHALRLSISLVGYARGEAPPLEPVDLGLVVDRMLAVLVPVLPSDIVVRPDIAALVPPVRGAAVELEQLVLNLVLNAADAMPGGGELIIRVQPTGTAAVYLEVSDTGRGLPPEPRSPDGGPVASTRRGRRTGLGLGIVRRVVARHGGSIRFAPRVDRTGTIAWALLPTA
ncbi:MAG TPA: ATP-binding protein [Kofleriaceae bacterium]|jgi:signal transduction histidine kinase|nr:ATP-binding protein [Kofleriaceae bacterium]